MWPLRDTVRNDVSLFVELGSNEVICAAGDGCLVV